MWGFLSQGLGIFSNVGILIPGIFLPGIGDFLKPRNFYPRGSEISENLGIFVPEIGH